MRRQRFDSLCCAVILLGSCSSPAFADERAFEFSKHEDEMLQREREILKHYAKDTPFAIDQSSEPSVQELFGIRRRSKPRLDLALWYGKELNDYLEKPINNSEQANRAYSLALETVEMSIDGDSSLKAPIKLLNMLTEQKFDSLSHEDLLKRALRLMNIAFQVSIDAKAQVERETVLSLASLRAWSGDEVGASEIYEWLLPAMKSTNDISSVKWEQEDFDVLALIAVMNARHGDWKKVRQFESLCREPKSVALTNALLRCYRNFGRTEDLLRLFRLSCESEQQATPDISDTVISAATEADRDMIAAFLKRKSESDLRLCLELEKRGWHAEALQVALQNPGPNEVNKSVERLAGTRKQDDLVRLAVASSVVSSSGNIKLLRFILGKIVETIPVLPATSKEDLDFNEKVCAIVVKGLSACQDAECIALLKKLTNYRYLISEARVKDDILELALKLQAGGESLQAIGHYAESLKMLSSALEIRRKYLLKDDALIAETIESLAEVNAQLKQNSAADALFQECIAFYRRNNQSSQLKTALKKYEAFLGSIGRK